MKADDRGTTPPMMVVFAGPNGSGKSTINREFLSTAILYFKGEYINADDIAKTLEKRNSRLPGAKHKGRPIYRRTAN